MGPSQHHIEAHGPSRGEFWTKVSRPHLWFGILLGFFILLGLTLFLPPTIPPYLLAFEELPIYQCGNSPEEASRNGCRFDVISFSWLPPACFDAQLVDDFLATSKWQWYKDSETNTTIPVAEVYQGQHELLYVSWDYHFSHCTYMWAKLHRAVLYGYPIDGYIGNIHHTAHCSDLLLRQDDFRASGKTTMIFTKYPSCGEDVGAMAAEGHSGWYRMQNGSRNYEVPGGKVATVEHHD
ncbi:hypothetical protein UA08_07391 [Talaromyces atroroseus]|uniref:Uncharacterized protein n=1 Tax=Talaromyces atroroseus TaxID=1441469 RepID=A0A225AQV9_TALAT|nr:hypothetical protein UA08_07391 [Talaromyces atroroseus]OKL57306.1 hypothetical protein UA08_07391 [Talaromyces atroroseus]